MGIDKYKNSCEWCVNDPGISIIVPDRKVHGANMGPIWGRQHQVGTMLAPGTLLSVVWSWYHNAIIKTSKMSLIWINVNLFGRRFVLRFSYWLPHSYVTWDDPDSKVHGANMGSNWVLSALDGPYVGPMNLAIRGRKRRFKLFKYIDIYLYFTPTVHIEFLHIF